MDGYYDPWPLVQLERPLALVGFVTPDVSAVGSILASLVALPLVETDRRLEHEVGLSRHEFALRFGMEELRRVEGEIVRRVLGERPAGVIVLGDGALLDEETLERVLGEADLVHLARDFERDLSRLAARHERADTAAGAPDPAVHREALARLFDARQPGYRTAPRVHDMKEERPNAVALRLLRSLGWSSSEG